MPLRRPLGRPLGPLSRGGVNSGKYINSGRGYTFAIAGLPFNIAPMDELPYERETADFRREQIDDAPVVGDQSLTGWWTRGQLSFHAGAGLRFMDNLSGAEVQHRFRASDGVDPREPGEVTCLTEDAQIIATTYEQVVSNRTPRTFNYPGIGLTPAGGVVEFSDTTSQALTLSTAGTAYMLAPDGANNLYIATTNGVERLTVSGTTAALLSAHSTDATYSVGVWWAKNRIFTVDDVGDWYTMPASGETQDISSQFWSSAITATDGNPEWSLVDTPSSVFIGQGQRVYAVSLDVDGSVPVITSGLVAADLPQGESVRSLTYTAGYLVIGTTAGVRVAQVQGPEILYGPLMTKGTASRHTAIRGTTVYLGLDIDTQRSVVAVDLSQPIPDTDLEFALFDWKVYDSITIDVGNDRDGVVVLTDADVRTLPVEPDGVTALAQGALYTGYHRMGTLEPKIFRSVKVRISGAGSVVISRVLPDGSELAVYTHTSSTDRGRDITLRLDEPVEYLGLKFTLVPDTEDPSTGPVLEGYQLRAMPAPRRQRLINIPLLCFDVERASNGVEMGGEGTAWRRLAALEDLESSGAISTFQDFRTGEAGSAYIDKVRFINRTPPSSKASGFGGYLMLSLRKVD